MPLTEALYGDEMPNQDDELLTEDQLENGEQGSGNEEVDPEEGGSGHSDPSESGNRQRKPFLVVDERTQYATRDEAVKAYSEAGKRISALSAWEKELKDYGDLTPAEVREYLEELINSRQSVEQLNSQLSQLKKEREEAERRSQTESQTRTRVEGEQKMTREEKDAVDWLKDKLPSLGYISKEDAMKLITELQGKVGQFDKFESFMNESNERYRQSLIQEARSNVTSMMAEDGFEDDEEGSFRLTIENNIRAYIESDPKRMEKFYAGGAVTDKIVKEAYQWSTRAFSKFKSSQASSYAKNKADALRRNGKAKLPTQNTVSGKPLKSGKPQQRVDASGKRDFIGEKHNEAWDIASKYFSNEGSQE